MTRRMRTRITIYTHLIKTFFTSTRGFLYGIPLYCEGIPQVFNTAGFLGTPRLIPVPAQVYPWQVQVSRGRGRGCPFSTSTCTSVNPSARKCTNPTVLLIKEYNVGPIKTHSIGTDGTTGYL